MKILVAHSPDPDDAFMFYAMVKARIDTGPYEFVQTYHDIETLNRMCMAGEPDLSAASAASYPYLWDRYLLMRSGASVGKGYGPVIVAREPLSPSDLKDLVLAVPGEMTTAFLAARLAVGEFRYTVIPFDRIISAVRSGAADAGLLIHEGQLTYEQEGLFRVLDLGEWWSSETGLPLVLGVNLVKKDLGPVVISDLSRILSESISYALSHSQEALDYAAGFGRGLSTETLERFVNMYVNRQTEAMDREALMGLSELLMRAKEKGLVPDFRLEIV
ncbi:MAG: MqnA/MqnD/SBP family protein [candidate division WOR-3 bacterium]